MYASVPTVGGTYGDISSLTLTPGRWSLCLLVVFNVSSAAGRGPWELHTGIGNNSGSDTTGMHEGINQGRHDYLADPSVGFYFTISIPPYTTNITSTKTFYAKTAVTTGALSVTPQVVYRFSATRIS